MKPQIKSQCFFLDEIIFGRTQIIHAIDRMLLFLDVFLNAMC